MTSNTLSEKAKGKQRATEPVNASSPSQAAAPKTLVIRFSEGHPDLTLQIEEQDAVRDVKRQVCTLLSKIRLVLIQTDSGI